jgi:hypothetical protein
LSRSKTGANPVGFCVMLLAALYTTIIKGSIL